MALKKWLLVALVLIFLFILFISSIYTESAAQKQSGGPSIGAQWKSSPHAGSGDSPEELQRMNAAECAHCHTSQGYWEVFLDGKESSAPYENVSGLNCLACHLPPPEEGGPPGLLRVGDAKAACKGCHDLIVRNNAEELSWCSQWMVFRGHGGAEFSDKDFSAGAHSGLHKNCASCHMAPAGSSNNPLIVGGHTFRVMTKGETRREFNASACIGCHPNISPAMVSKSQDEVRSLLKTLENLLPQKIIPSEDEHRMLPKLPEDPTLSKVQAQASFNYWIVSKDGSFGVHNPGYTRRLLEDSIQALKEE